MVVQIYICITHIYYKNSINKSAEQFYNALLRNDYKLTLKLAKSLLRTFFKKTF